MLKHFHCIMYGIVCLESLFLYGLDARSEQNGPHSASHFSVSEPRAAAVSLRSGLLCPVSYAVVHLLWAPMGILKPKCVCSCCPPSSYNSGLLKAPCTICELSSDSDNFLLCLNVLQRGTIALVYMLHSTNISIEWKWISDTSRQNAVHKQGKQYHPKVLLTKKPMQKHTFYKYLPRNLDC